jgi:hypothetical protein
MTQTVRRKKRTEKVKAALLEAAAAVVAFGGIAVICTGIVS